MPDGVHSMNEPFINRELMDKVLQIRERTFEDELFTDMLHVTDLYYKAMNFTEDELIASVVAALAKCPDKVYQALAYDRAELVRKGKRNETDKRV